MDYAAILEKYRHLLSGCRTISDAHYFTHAFLRSVAHDSVVKDITDSMIKGRFYDDVLDMKTMDAILSNIYKGHDEISSDDVFPIRCTDLSQSRTIFRMTNAIKKRMNRSSERSLNIYQDMIEKQCPHCKHKTISNAGTEYYICGYSDTTSGYDWTGCGKDWCFNCGKRLCKDWKLDRLFVTQNRLHDGVCCHEYAIKMELDYSLFCQCHNDNVKRSL